MTEEPDRDDDSAPVDEPNRDVDSTPIDEPNRDVDSTPIDEPNRDVDSTPIDGVLAGDRSNGDGDGDGPSLDFGGGVNGPAGETDSTADGPASDTGGESASAPTGAGLPPADAVPESDEDEVEPVELLVQLAEDGEIEPWDIDIVEVTDAFLAKLDETDLRTTGRALFYASVLLRMKSDELLAPDEEEEAPDEPWLEDDGAMAAPGYDPVDALEAEMDRRLDRKHARGSPETLDELVRDLREVERESRWKASRTYDTSSSPRGYQRGTQTLDYHDAGDLREDGEPGEEDVTGTTHDEDIEVVIADVRAVLDEQYEQGRTEVLFRELRGAGGTEVMTYLSLLFLAHRGAVRLEQDDLFGDLWVQDPTAPVVGEAEAVADGGCADDDAADGADATAPADAADDPDATE